MDNKIRIYELAKELVVDSRKIMDVLQSMGVDVKNHMSAIDQTTAEKVIGTVRGGEKKESAPAAASAAPKAPAAKPAAPPRRDANPARASLLDLYFGEGATSQRARPDLREKAKPAKPSEPERPPQQPRRTESEAVGPRRQEQGRNLQAQRRPSRESVDRASAPRRADDVPALPTVTATAVFVPALPAAPDPPVTPKVPVIPAPAVEAAWPAPDSQTPAAQAPVTQAASPAVAEAPGVADRPAAPAIKAPVAPEPRVAEPAASRPAAAERGKRPETPPAHVTPPPAPIGRPVLPNPRIIDGPRPVGRPGPSAGPQQPGFGPRRDGPDRGPRPDGGPRPRPEFGPRPGFENRPGGGPGLPGPVRGDQGGFGPRPGAGRSGPGPSLGRGPRPEAGRPARGPRPLVIPKPELPKNAQPEQKRGDRPGIPVKRKDTGRRRDDFRREGEAKINLPFRRPGDRKAAALAERKSRPVVIEGTLSIKDFASKLGVTAAEVIKKLLEVGIMATINQEIDTDTATLVGTDLGFIIEVKPPEPEVDYEAIVDENEDPALLMPRWPVVTVMGHVDHGKTSLLDAIRETKVAAGEAGGITQHIGAYTVELNGRKITFLDTPGHEAFTAMRARGAQVTDIAVLVVAADDGVMPQTVEAINHAKAAKVPIVVAINKIDKHNANPDRVKQELTEHNLVIEEWGGDVIAVPVSAKERTGIEHVLEMILLQSEVLELKANPDKEARGTIIEAQLDKGRGPVATVLIQAGTLQIGAAFVAGAAHGKVRAMYDDKGKKLKKAGPSMPVEIIGFTEVPHAGDIFRVVEDEKKAREIAEKRSFERRAEEMETTTRLTLDDLYKRIKEGEVKDLNLIVKADVQGSVEAVRQSLEKLHNEEVQVKVLHGGVGAITESDVLLASASRAIIIGFNVRPDPNASRAAQAEQVDIRTYRVIYEAVDDIKSALEGMLKPKMEEVVLGRVEVRALFKVPKAGTVAGCYVLDGKVTKNASIRVLRNSIVVAEDQIESLRRFKDDVREVLAGFECGIGLEKFNDLKEGDIFEAFTVQEVSAAKS